APGQPRRGRPDGGPAAGRSASGRRPHPPPGAGGLAPGHPAGQFPPAGRRHPAGPAEQRQGPDPPAGGGDPLQPPVGLWGPAGPAAGRSGPAAERSGARPVTRRLCAALACLALCLGLLAGCASQPQSATVSDSVQRFTAYYFDVFDTMTQVIAYCDSQAEFDRQAEALHADLVAYHQLYDIYNDYEGINNIKTINDNAGVAPVQVDERILDMLELAVEMYDTTNGKLNIAMSSVLAIWHDYREAAEADPSDADNQLPTQEELEAAAQHCNIEDVIIDREAGTVYLAAPEMRLDVGSVGKGYAVEQVCQAARERGLVSLSLSVGGNLRSVGSKPQGQPWESGIVSPWDDSLIYNSGSSLLAVVNSNDQALVTSGDYQRFYTVDGVRYHHIIDPDTLWPADYFTAVTILCPDSGLADCLSTGVFCMPLEEGMAPIESLEGVEALWCTKDGQVIRSSGFAQY